MLFILIKLDKEIYKHVTYPGVKRDMYAISNYGNLMNIKTGKIKKQYNDKDGYLQSVMMLDSNKSIPIKIHRLVAWEFVEGYDEENKKIVVNHINSVRQENYYQNLEWCTVKENTIHGYENGNCKRGEDNYRSKYSQKLIEKICREIDRGLNNIEIMKKFKFNKKRDNISLYDLIRDTRRGKCWRFVSKKYNFMKEKGSTTRALCS